MEKNAIGFICILAGLILMMPCAIADLNQNETQNATGNVTQNITQNVTQNVTQNMTRTVVQNATQNATKAAMENVLQNVTQNSMQNVTQDFALNNAQSTMQNEMANSTKTIIKPGKVLRAGFAKTKPLNNLDVYGSKSTYDIKAWSVGGFAFNISQRLGKVSNITYNTNIYKPTYEVSKYSRVKPNYEVPSNINSKSIYKISGYPAIKIPISMP
jgi:hypothetical protein